MYWIYTNKIFLYISPGDSMDKIGRISRISRICKFSIWWISRIYKENILYISPGDSMERIEEIEDIEDIEDIEENIFLYISPGYSMERIGRISRRFKIFTPWKIWRIEKPRIFRTIRAI